MKIHLEKNVYEAALDRIRWIYREFPNVIINVSGGKDSTVIYYLGMEADEMVRLKHITGFAKLFENIEYRRAWETTRQIRLRTEYLKEHPEEVPPT